MDCVLRNSYMLSICGTRLNVVPQNSMNLWLTLILQFLLRVFIGRKIMVETKFQVLDVWRKMEIHCHDWKNIRKSEFYCKKKHITTKKFTFYFKGEYFYCTLSFIQWFMFWCDYTPSFSHQIGIILLARKCLLKEFVSQCIIVSSDFQFSSQWLRFFSCCV